MNHLDNEEIVYQLNLLALAIHEDKPSSIKNWASDFVQRISKGGVKMKEFESYKPKRYSKAERFIKGGVFYQSKWDGKLKSELCKNCGGVLGLHLNGIKCVKKSRKDHHV